MVVGALEERDKAKEDGDVGTTSETLTGEVFCEEVSVGTATTIVVELDSGKLDMLVLKVVVFEFAIWLAVFGCVDVFVKDDVYAGVVIVRMLVLLYDKLDGVVEELVFATIADVTATVIVELSALVR